MATKSHKHPQATFNQKFLQGGPGGIIGRPCQGLFSKSAPPGRFIFIFLDGVGIGEPTGKNPFYAVKSEFLPFYKGNPGLPDKTPIKPIDALLGVEGVPQSGSGQTSLYTGENIPRILGQHRDSYPNRLMRKIIGEKNILRRLKDRGYNAVFINAYPAHKHLFSAPNIQIRPSGELHFSDEFPALFKRRISVTTCMMVTAQQVPFDEKDILAERSIFQEYSNRWLNKKGLPLPEFTPEKAAEILYNSSQHYDFLLYEYFQTDIFAHRRGFDDQVQLIKDLNSLMGKLISLLDPAKDTLLVTSDHGNLEDSTQKNHTCNPVPLIVWGYLASPLRDSINKITDVTPTILRCF